MRVARTVARLAIATVAFVGGTSPSLADLPNNPLPPHVAPMRPPAAPLIACDPYFSVWSAADRLADADTTHWTGKPHRLTSLATIDGQAYRLMGREPSAAPALEQTAATITPTQTRYVFAGGGVEIALTFTTPALPDDVDLLSRPITYVTYDVRATDGQPHDVGLYFEASAELTVNTPDQPVAGDVAQAEPLVALRLGSQSQRILGRKGDDRRIDWGYFYLAAPADQLAGYALGAPEQLRGAFVAGAAATGAATASSARADDLAAAVSFALPDVGGESVARHLIVAYDDLFSIEYMHRPLRPYWRRHGLEAAGLLADAERDYANTLTRCRAFDDELTADLVAAGGREYADIATLAYRQCFAAGKFVADDNGQPLQFSKENHSNGCIATSDVFYPMAPQFLLFGPTLAKSFLVPFMNYAASDRWRFPFAPHDLGTYPKANGQVYGGGERSEENQMPVEECGNLLLLMAAVARLEGDASFAELYWPQLAAWAEYLKTEGFDPDNQLCTDDFAGHLAHNVNLSAKAICALGAYAQLCELRGDAAAADEYRRLAEEFAARWITEADDGDHFRLSFDRPGTWSQKYNLVWDRLLGLNLFPDDVRRKEMDHYRRVQARYGLPLDNRSTYTKLDWILWTATLTQNRDDFEALVSPVHRFLNETSDRAPLTDWYHTHNARKVGFTARPVVGGVFLQMLYDEGTWRKWSSRERTRAAGYAPMPQPPRLTRVVPAADTAPAVWRFVTSPPKGDWFAADYDDSSWREGQSGFGARGTPGAVLGQRWTSPQIWLRRTFDIGDAAPASLQLYIHHDEDADVYVNGLLAARCEDFSTQYETVPMSAEALASLRPQGNVLAVHCRQTRGGQYIDAGLVQVVVDER